MNSSDAYPRMNWSLIKEAFQGEWVELIEYQWEWNAPFPRFARVRFHSTDRKDLLQLIQSSSSSGSSSDESLILFVGQGSAVIEPEPRSALL